MKPMRRTDKLKSEDFGKSVIAQAEYGILSLVDEMGNPYAVPISHVLVDNTIYIHGAHSGTKLDLIAQHSRVCFTCVSSTYLIAQEFTTDYKSAIAYGDASVVDSDEEKDRALDAIVQKYAPEFPREAEKYIQKHYSATTVIKIEIDYITAKAQHMKEKS
jgi:nitroimidazol reductase NimA-like FMN-containing flavoprotein (pyridoxamine 5'-phosphate oxidase superfamily)